MLLEEYIDKGVLLDRILRATQNGRSIEFFNGIIIVNRDFDSPIGVQGTPYTQEDILVALERVYGTKIGQKPGASYESAS